MTPQPEKSTEKKTDIAVTPETGEELAEHQGPSRTGGLVDDDELLAQSGKKGGLTGDDIELA